MDSIRYEIIRTSKSGVFFIIIDGIEIPLYNENLVHFEAIPIEILQLTGEQFEFYKEIIAELEPIINALKYIYNNYRSSGDNKFYPQFIPSRNLQILLETDLITQSERFEIETYFQKLEKQKQLEIKRNAPTYIYLMKDERTGFTKIGRSANPSFREKTLQSDNPMIILIRGWLGKQGDEKELHKRFTHKRFRGEWFELDEGDIEEIFEIFADRDIWK